MKISLAQWSLHNTFFAGTANPLEFPAIAMHDFGISAVEYVNRFFRDEAQSWFNELKRRAEDAGVRSLLIMCDGEGRLGDPNATLRREAVERHYRWVETAAYLGCHAIRVNPDSEGSYEEQLLLAADGLRTLTEFGASHGISIITENHGGLSSNGAWHAELIKSVQHPNCGTLPDFGNFRLGEGLVYDRYQGIRELMPFAKGVSAKSWDFDEAGNETEIDYERMLQIVQEAGYTGYIGIEYEGSRLSEPEGIRATKGLLERYVHLFDEGL
jgi:sugar phosphate isomerase/epimerase